MLHALSGHIAECLAHAVEAERRANETRDPAVKADFSDVAARWRRLAESYQFVERLERFLVEAKTTYSKRK